MSRTVHAKSLTVATATAADREEIYRLRHEVYARELGQHRENGAGRLTDALDDGNHYLCARQHGRVTGFVSLTPPGGASYSVDKYVARDRLPFEFDDRLFEVRLLTVTPSARGSRIAALLMYAAFRWVEAHGGTRIIAIGRREVSRLYRKAGLLGTGIHVTSGAVTFEVLHATTSDLRAGLARLEPVLARLESDVDWQLHIGFRRPAPCFHGGAFFEAIGPRCDALHRRDQIINADVLDAWFPPSPRVTAALHEHLPWLLGTSPPNHAEGLVASIAEARAVGPENVLPGAGSSSLIFLALRHWLKPTSRALVLDPMYAEYAHVLEHVIGCRVDRLALRRDDGYRVSPSALAAALERDYDLVVLVNPNSPTGQHLSRETLEPVLRRAPLRTRIWIDETYLDYVGSDESLERFAASSENVVVSKSMSKAYALSGARVAYLCAGAHQIEGLRPQSPPWAVSLPAQVAAIEALRAFLPSSGPDAAEVVARCRERGLFLRDAAGMGTGLGDRAVRVAVKDAATQRRMIDILTRVVGKGASVLCAAVDRTLHSDAMKIRKLHRFAIVTFVLAALPPLAGGERPVTQGEWPQWRGALGTGVSATADPPLSWSEKQNVRWKVPIPGKGHSTPVVWGERIFLTTAVPYGEALTPDHDSIEGGHDNMSPSQRQKLVVLAVSRHDGKILWEREVRTVLPHETTHTSGSWASHSPITDGKRVFASFGSGGLYALDVSGALLWSTDLGDMQSLHGHGEGSSPALHGDTLIVNWDHQGGSFVVALDARSGKEKWRVARDEITSWSTPLIVEVAGKPQVIIAATKRVRAYDLASGNVVWECGGLGGNVVASPVAADGFVYVANSYETRAMLAIRLAGAKGDITGTDAVVWTRDRDTPYVPSPLLYGDMLCFLKHYQGLLTCVNARTGATLFGPERLPGIRDVYASPVGAADRIYVVDRNGTTVVVKRSTKFELLAENRLDDSFSASPALAGTDLYLRGEHHLYSLAEAVATE